MYLKIDESIVIEKFKKFLYIIRPAIYQCHICNDGKCIICKAHILLAETERQRNENQEEKNQ